MKRIKQLWRHRGVHLGLFAATAVLAIASLAGMVMATPAHASAAGAVWPASGTITGMYGDVRNGHTHIGIDVANSSGTPLYADQDGTAYRNTSDPSGYGNAVVIAHSNGYKSVYGHLSSFSISNGQVVHQGDLVGYMGATGDATGPHVHYEVRSGASFDGNYNGTSINFNSATSRNAHVTALTHINYNFVNMVGSSAQYEVANVNGCGALFIKLTWWGNWDQHMGCGQAKQVSLSPDGQYIWVVRPDNTLIAKSSYWGAWDYHTAVGDSVYAAAGPNGMVASVNSCGALFIKRSYWGTWDQHMGCGQAKAVSVSSDGNYIWVVRPDNTLIGKSSYWGNWDYHTAVGNSMGLGAGPNGEIANITPCGQLFIKKTYWGTWDQHTGCNSAKSVALSPDGQAVAIVRSDGALVAKETYWGGWVAHTNPNDSQSVSIAQH